MSDMKLDEGDIRDLFAATPFITMLRPSRRA